MQGLETICPYPGLRPFTEEESLYFKGREDQIINLAGVLQEKKFLMVTGASGDGKSSLIYGGLIPHARAGFFKATYTKWNVAAFRPERTPLKNMTDSLATQLQLDPDTVAVELSRGFSSLVELFKSSSLYIDKESKAWREAGDEERAILERQAGNLLVIIDQFEEFFTNPENLIQGVPSQDSRLLLNIILETSKISLRNNLPIYIVCTMRSDYIGHCAAFQGLPEYIGFAQFFVPRLQRKELHHVIEEPASLNGNKISNRLTDRLIFDLEEGPDQLPILQHALKQIWKAADNGREKMDLIHYAMVGGMDGEKLPIEDLVRFREWKEKLPEYEKKYLEKPGLSNVLDIHANTLYEEAATCYNKNAVRPLTTKETKLIIALTFSCLTRIDETGQSETG
jgi:energy-coupling factor transporter ATP-binding protein EcfA2